LDHELKESFQVNGAHDMLLLMPLYTKGTLQDYLDIIKTDSKRSFSTKQITSIFLSACNGISVFHNHKPPQCHNDIKPDNMMVNENEVILFDFGSVGSARHQISSRQDALTIQEWADSNCTPLFKAPELFNVASDAVLDERTDIWALGCTLYAMMFAYSPFERDAETGSIALAITSGAKFPDDAYKRYPAELIELAKSMLSMDPTNRPFIDSVINDLNKFTNEGEISIQIDS